VKKIYIILTHTGTVLSKIVKWYTRDEFSHISIALDQELTQMYSFGRLYPTNPFIGGFVHEYIDKGTFKHFSKTVANVYSIEIEDEQFNKIKDIINKMQDNSTQYKFNILGLLAVAFHIRIRIRNYFYCAEFVKYVLENADMDTGLPEIIKPEDFKQLQNIKSVYEGRLQEYNLKTKLNNISQITVNV